MPPMLLSPLVLLHMFAFSHGRRDYSFDTGAVCVLLEALMWLNSRLNSRVGRQPNVLSVPVNVCRPPSMSTLHHWLGGPLWCASLSTMMQTRRCARAPQSKTPAAHAVRVPTCAAQQQVALSVYRSMCLSPCMRQRWSKDG
jgi:hypothetical protein